MAIKRMMNGREATAFLGVSKNVLTRWNHLGIGPPRVRKGKRWYYVLDVLKDWLSQNAPAVASISAPAPVSSRHPSLSPSSASAFPR
jgi:predicted site-specific integrase-resolvase